MAWYTCFPCAQLLSQYMCLIVRYLYSYLTLCKVRGCLFGIIILNKLDYIVRTYYNLKSTDPCYTRLLQLLDFRSQGSTPDLQRQQKGRVSTKMSSDSPRRSMPFWRHPLFKTTNRDGPLKKPASKTIILLEACLINTSREKI